MSAELIANVMGGNSTRGFERNLYLVEDDDSLRELLRFQLTNAGYAVRPYACAEALLDDIEAAPAGCVVTDVRMADMDGVELTQRLRERRLTLPIVVLTGNAGVALAVRAMKAGADDFIEKSTDIEPLLCVLSELADRQRAEADATAERGRVESRLDSLSVREREVLDQILAGRTSRQIGDTLEISFRTVDVHRANIMSKMGATRLAHLVRMVSLDPR